MSIAEQCRSIPGVLDASADVIPGPPPEYAECRIINVMIGLDIRTPSGEVLLDTSRSLCYEVLALLTENEALCVPSTAISIVTRCEDRPVRIYSVTVPAAKIADVCSGEIRLQDVAANEFSMLDSVIELINAIDA